MIGEPNHDQRPLGQHSQLLGDAGLLGPTVVPNRRARPGGASELAVPLADKKIVAAARAAGGRVQHVAVDGMAVLQMVEPFGSAACTLGRAAEVENDHADG